ncbi:hypothetical protein EDC96DRAFT_305099 [Choanephora cucurbitarum]|nr:hypothetical protein EDC96DRAFT_305099 [Choanephora cucurbitarum]
MMTFSDNLELEPQQPLVNEEATRKKKPYKSTRYKRGGGVTNYRSTNPTRYYNEALSAYPLNYMYYPSMSFPVIFDQNNTQNDEDLEIIMHDESSLNTPTESMVPITKPIENKTVDLKGQLEYYFSRQNLVNDAWLVSQMDAELYVPISLVANFKRVREWTTDIELITKTLRESSEVTVDETGTKVKPNISVQRKTVILRDVPECTEEEIQQLLQDLKAPPTQSIKKDIGNMWYFTFENEEDALKLLLSVRGKSFKDQAIAARMKSEPALRVQTRPQPSVQENVKIPEMPSYYYYQPSLPTVYHTSYRPAPFHHQPPRQNYSHHYYTQKDNVLRNAGASSKHSDDISSSLQRTSFRSNHSSKQYTRQKPEESEEVSTHQKNNRQRSTKTKETEANKHEHKKKPTQGSRHPNNRNHGYRGGNRKNRNEEFKPAHFPPLQGPEEQTVSNLSEKSDHNSDNSATKSNHSMSYADMLKKKEVE